MKKEYKELLLKDLCARLPYGVKVSPKEKDTGEYDKTTGLNYIYPDVIDVEAFIPDGDNTRIEYRDWIVYLDNIQMYLRPMSSMTEDEAKEMFNVLYPKLDLIKVEIVEDRVRYYAIGNGWIVIFFNRIYTTEQMDWLLEKHFDFRGLIDLDLAIRVTEENNPYKN